MYAPRAAPGPKRERMRVKTVSPVDEATVAGCRCGSSDLLPFAVPRYEIIIIIMYSAKHLYCATRQPITPSERGVAVLNHVTNAPGMSE